MLYRTASGLKHADGGLMPRAEFPIQLVGRLLNQLCFLPHQLQGLPYHILIDFEVLRLRNG